MFLKVKDGHINVDHIARVDYVTQGNKFCATVYFAKPGGADRHVLYDDDARKLQNALNKCGAVQIINESEGEKLC